MAWQAIRDLVYRRGSRISDTIEKKPGVPAYAKIREEIAEIASVKLGLPTSL